MKKNTMMRIASFLMIAVLLTTCAISGTYAKYTSNVTVKDSARVAYWGFNQATLTTLDLFKYEATDVSNTAGIVTGLVAPGTANEIKLNMVYTDNGDIKAPEVKYDLDVAVEVTGEYAHLEALDSFSFTLNGEKKTLAEIEAALEAATGTYAADTLPAIFETGATLGWAWAIDGDDAADTALGNATNLQNVAIEISITATQVNE